MTIAVPPPLAGVRLLAVLMAPAMVVIMGIDLRIRGSEEFLLHGVADATAHLLTALVILAAVRALGVPVNWAMAGLGAVVADLDYLLIKLDLMDRLGESSRGLLHTLAPALGVILLGLVLPWVRVAGLSLGMGMLTHVLRDSATAATVVLWPLSGHLVHLRYSHFLALLLMCTVIVTGSVALGCRSISHHDRA